MSKEVNKNKINIGRELVKKQIFDGVILFVALCAIFCFVKVFGFESIPHIKKNDACPFSSDDKKLIDGIVDECTKYSASALVDITHQQTPWKDAYRPYCNAPIPNESIKQFFKEA